MTNSGDDRFGLGLVVRDLRGGFALRPGAITIALAATAIGLSSLEERVTTIRAWSDVLDRIFPPEPEAAYVVLGTIAGSMITVVAMVYSILLVVLTFASTQFSPRVLVAFVEDRVSQTTLGVFVGTFTYCLLTLPAVRSRPTPFVPSIAVVVAIGLAIACLGCLLYFIHHMASRIQASHVVDRIAAETERVLDGLFAGPLDGPPPASEGDSPPIGPGATVPATRSGYIRSVDERGLLAAAVKADAIVRVDRAIGLFVMEGTPLFEVAPADRATAAMRAAALPRLRDRPGPDDGAGRRVRRAADRGYRAEGDLAGGERPDDRADLHRPARADPGPCRAAEAAGAGPAGPGRPRPRLAAGAPRSRGSWTSRSARSATTARRTSPSRSG